MVHVRDIGIDYGSLLLVHFPPNVGKIHIYSIQTPSTQCTKDVRHCIRLELAAAAAVPQLESSLQCSCQLHCLVYSGKHVP